MLNSLLELLFPAQCLHCKVKIQTGEPLCTLCAKSINRIVKSRTIDGIPHLYSSLYNPVTASLILKAKEENNKIARSALAEMISSALPNSNSILVPVPSRKSAHRKRGFRHGTLLAEGAISLAGGNKNQILDCLFIQESIRDQSALSLSERVENVSGKVTVKMPRIMKPISRNLFIVDDLVTSGASAREAIRALRAENIAIMGVISACAALPY